MIEAGTTAPNFTLSDQDGHDVSLSDFRGRTVILYFYPKADTSGSIGSHDRCHAPPRNRDRPRLAA